ncbi:MAG: hypothetical protein JKX85_00625 [Phycisphaeraceae bacterium]|nr:hypothetical protein [Phycisphaeraceae bacterium]
MLNRLNILRILCDNFYLYEYSYCPVEGGLVGPHLIKPRYSCGLFIVFLFVPVALAESTLLLCGIYSKNFLPNSLAIASLTAGVLMASLPMMQAVASGIKLKDKYLKSEIVEPDKILRLIGRVSELYSAVSFCILISIFSIVPQLILLTWKQIGWLDLVLSWLIYSSGYLVAINMVKIIVGLYSILDYQSTEIQKVALAKFNEPHLK